MSWKFWKKNEPEYYVETQDIPATTLYRWFLYDLGIENPNKYADSAGFSPVSPEGDEFERRESLERLLQVIPYKPFIEMMAAFNGEILSKTLTNILKDNNLVDDEFSLESDMHTMAELYTKVSASVLVPAFAAALELGILVNPGMYTDGDFYE